MVVARRLLVALAIVVAVTACSTAPATVPTTTGMDGAADATPAPTATVVVTFSVLGRLVEQLVDGSANVVVIVPDGQDPHDYQPSARDMATMAGADLLVANGLGFEAYLDDAIGAAASGGTAVFTLAEHVTVHAANDGDDHGHGHGDGDPHLWLSPATMLEALPDLATAISTALGTPVDASAIAAELHDLDAELAEQFAALEGCELVTGHDELGYFADRYGCEVIGAVLPSMSTTADASARHLAELKDVIAGHRATTVFTSIGTPQAVAEQIARETGARVVELRTHSIDGSATYASFIRDLADAILGGLR